MELSKEFIQELLSGLINDASRFGNKAGDLYNRSLDHRELEQLVYITEQMRLKLRMLGAPRIN